jgi:hypothetical protein
MDKNEFPRLLRAIYESVDALETMFPGRHFTPDGHMIGSLGEALITTASRSLRPPPNVTTAFARIGRCRLRPPKGIEWLFQANRSIYWFYA